MGPNGFPGRIIKQIGSISYIVSVDGRMSKCHAEQLLSYARPIVGEPLLEERHIEFLPAPTIGLSEGNGAEKIPK